MNFTIKIIIILLITVSCSNTSEIQYSTNDLIENYEEKSNEINNLKEFFKNITPKSIGIYIEFKSDDSIDMKMWKKSDTAKKSAILWFQEWNINPYDYKMKDRSEYELKYGGKTNSIKEVMEKLNWQENNFKEIKSKLDKANCISIMKTSDYYEIGFKRSGMGKYHYLIIDDLSIDEIKEKFNDGCLYKYYKENVVLYYSGGAIGRQCFEDYNYEE